MEKTIGERLRELRLSKGLSLTDVCAKTGAKNKAGLSGVELGRNIPTINTIKKIAEACGFAMEINFVPLGQECKELTIKTEDDSRKDNGNSRKDNGNSRDSDV